MMETIDTLGLFETSNHPAGFVQCECGWSGSLIDCAEEEMRDPWDQTSYTATVCPECGLELRIDYDPYGGAIYDVT